MGDKDLSRSTDHYESNRAEKKCNKSCNPHYNMWIKFGSTTQLYLFENLTVPLGVFAKTFTTEMKPRKRQAKKARRTWQKANYFPLSTEIPKLYCNLVSGTKAIQSLDFLIKLSTLTLFWPDHRRPINGSNTIKRRFFGKNSRGSFALVPKNREVNLKDDWGINNRF